MKAKTKIAILGFGKVGQVLLNTIRDNTDFGNRFEVVALWNRSFSVFESVAIPKGISVYQNLEDLLQKLDKIDLVVECAHPTVLHQYATTILRKTNLFVSSPTAFANAAFRQKVEAELAAGQYTCYIPLGASVGLWDVIRLDQGGQLEALSVIMKKHPDSFKIKAPLVLEKMTTALEGTGAIEIAKGTIAEMNEIAPQNTNTMAIYAMAASALGFDHCQGILLADRALEAHIIELRVKTKGGLQLTLIRDNPAGHGAVTGSATFGSFLNSLYQYSNGILHQHFTFC